MAGRPKNSDVGLPSRNVPIVAYVTPDQRAQIKSDAAMVRKSVSTYLLDLALPRAEQPSTDGTDAVSKGV